MDTSLSRTAKIYASASLLAVCVASTSASFAAPVVTSVEVTKSIEMLQTDPTTVVVDPGAPGGGPYGFDVDVDGQNISSISPAPTVTGPINAPPSFQNGGVLGFNPTSQRVGGLGGWRYGSPSFDGFGTTSLSDLNANFNNGIYTLAVNGANFSLNLTGPQGADAFPNTPILTLSGGVWSGGKYLIDPSQALTITTNAFSAYGPHPDDSMFLFSNGSINELQFFSAVPGTNFLTFTVPAFTFVAGNDYDVGAGFREAVDSSDAISGSHNDAFFGVSTRVVVSAVPEPSTFALMLACFGALGFAMRRKLP